MKSTIALCSALVLMMISCQGPQPVTPETLQRLKEGSRQIHLDFHTSEAIDSIGFKFDKKEFQDSPDRRECQLDQYFRQRASQLVLLSHRSREYASRTGF